MYFLEGGTLMEVEVSTEPLMRLGTPRKLIDGEETKLHLWRGIAMTEDGTRFIGARNPEEEQGEGEEEVEEGIHLVQNWFSDFSD